jgi:hypothetical protein
LSVHQKSSFLTLYTAFREYISIFCCTERNSELRLFRGMVLNRIPRICFYFSSTERNSALFSLPQKGSEQNYGSLFLYLVHGTEFRGVFSSPEGFGTEFRDFLFHGTTGIPSEITICSVYSVFRGIIFLSEIPNPTSTGISGCFQTGQAKVGLGPTPLVLTGSAPFFGGLSKILIVLQRRTSPGCPPKTESETCLVAGRRTSLLAE